MMMHSRRNYYGNGREQRQCQNCRCNECAHNRAALLRRVQTYGFALYDTILFLDTHPNDTSAIEYYENTLAKYREVRDMFEAKYGSLTAYEVDVRNGWTWTDAPSPWEYEAN